MTTIVYITSGRMRGKVGTIAGDIDNLNPHATKVFVTFPAEPYPRDYRQIPLSSMRRAQEWEIERGRDPQQRLAL